MDISFETDPGGFLSQDCPSCGRRFKVLFGGGSEAPLSFCPYCRHTGEDNWLTQEQLDYAKSVATEVLVRPELERLKRQVASTASDIIDIQVTEVTPEVTVSPVETIGNYDSVFFSCCAETIKAEQQERYYCIICGKKREMTMDRKSIFLSHRGSDKDMVLEFKGILEELGYKPWLDDEAMPAGTPLERGLLKGMQESCAVIFFVTPDFTDAGFLETEINYALTEKRKKGDGFAIIPLVLDGFGEKPGIESVVPPLLQQFVWKRPRSQIQALKEVLRALPKDVRNDSTDSSSLSTSRRDTGSDLSDDAKSVLRAAAEGGGRVTCMRTHGGGWVSAGGTIMKRSDEPRERARWEAAIEELRRHHYLKDMGHKGEVFELTKAGWDMADSLLDD